MDDARLSALLRSGVSSRPLVPFALALILGGVACGGASDSGAAARARVAPDGRIDSPRPRAVDDEPRPTAGRPDLPEGRGEVGFALDTGGDQMGSGPREAGLVVWARWRDGGLAQTVASCRSAGFGEPPPTETEHVASCDSEVVRLELVGGALVVTRGAETRTIALPDGVTFQIRDR